MYGTHTHCSASIDPHVDMLINMSRKPKNVDPIVEFYQFKAVSAIKVFNSIVLDSDTCWLSEKIDLAYFTSRWDHYMSANSPELTFEGYKGKITPNQTLDFSTIREQVIQNKYQSSDALFSQMEMVLKNAMQFKPRSKSAKRLYGIMEAMREQNVIKKALWKPCNNQCRTCPQCNNIMRPTQTDIALDCAQCNSKINDPEMNCYFCHNHRNGVPHIFCGECVQNEWYVANKSKKKRKKNGSTTRVSNKKKNSKQTGKRKQQFGCDNDHKKRRISEPHEFTTTNNAMQSPATSPSPEYKHWRERKQREKQIKALEHKMEGKEIEYAEILHMSTQRAERLQRKVDELLAEKQKWKTLINEMKQMENDEQMEMKMYEDALFNEPSVALVSDGSLDESEDDGKMEKEFKEMYNWIEQNEKEKYEMNKELEKRKQLIADVKEERHPVIQLLRIKNKTLKDHLRIERSTVDEKDDKIMELHKKLMECTCKNRMCESDSESEKEETVPLV
eukprot:106971_1